MSEAEWLACEDTKEMFRHLWDVFKCLRDTRKPTGDALAVFRQIGPLMRFTRRTITLFGVGCVRVTGGIDNQRRLRKAVSTAESAADTGEWGGVQRLHRAAWAAKVRKSSPAFDWAMVTAWLTGGETMACDVPFHLDRALGASGERRPALRGVFADILRDVFGNPFRPVTCDPAWRTDTAVSLAKGVYDGRDFSAMPILADALQDAGCENEDVLNHCRDPKATHVRGCWVVDLVLGKA